MTSGMPLASAYVNCFCSLLASGYNSLGILAARSWASSGSAARPLAGWEESILISIFRYFLLIACFWGSLVLPFHSH